MSIEKPEAGEYNARFASDLSDLVVEVNYWRKRGWMPQGAVQPVVDHSGSFTYYQAIVYPYQTLGKEPRITPGDATVVQKTEPVTTSATTEICKTKLITTLQQAKEKLRIYRDNVDGQYVGGVEFTQMIRQIVEAICLVGAL